ncbi:glycerophosphodiester phosphodiesterase [Paludibacterium paludis]|uniref:Glycerophosphoryl diester phosphodiesterase n=1 Tax=Paludibacterium paludis TaxID=1225769 RepID=A0A918UBH6_9NEIS|nr:glycerophosphodiester phosphodiesterase [Paludibacterium paludis]GGY23052.1 glycerophosphoryl diester phosphodiesterase [Paludibacterium paludis]
MSAPHRIRPWPYPEYLAHRGGGTLAPENTLAAFREGTRYGYRAAECDVKLSADGVSFLLHDDTVDRTSNGTGEAKALTMAQIARLDAGRWRGAAFAGEPMPTLASVAAHCLAQGMALNIEIKPCPGRETETGAAVAREAAALWQHAAMAPLLSSFSVEALRAARDEAPGLPRAMLFERVPDDWRAVLEELGAVAVHCDHRELDEARVREIKSAGYAVMCYTVNRREDAERLLAWGVDAICTDRIDQLGP